MLKGDLEERVLPVLSDFVYTPLASHKPAITGLKQECIRIFLHFKRAVKNLALAPKCLLNFQNPSQFVLHFLPQSLKTMDGNPQKHPN